ncbi:acyl-CoA desaturase [Anatilimnocola sp. NA78]|uniref:acyl-CoA desaturase n=1 Tax=Anatilimnocola sp. NA78 TaxID=3415683 RepID=UPI003CE566C5
MSISNGPRLGVVSSERAGATTDNTADILPVRVPTQVPHPTATNGGRLIWSYIIPIVGFHLLLPLAFVPWLFSWTGLALIPIGNFIFCSMGIGAGYHRLLTHRGFTCPKWLEHTLAILGVCTLQDTPARWVAVHRLHHQHSDQQPDPHTPRVSWYWAHVGWLFVENKSLSGIGMYERYARDILQDPFYLRLERNVLWGWIFAAHALAFYLVGMTVGWIYTGTYMGGVQFGLSILLWGVIFRTLYTWHVTWAVNSITHMWGYRNYATREDSRNNVICAMATNGEGWHNNHHAQPRAAAHGHRWYELDLTYVAICTLEMLGLAKNVVRPKPLAPYVDEEAQEKQPGTTARDAA